MPNTVSNLEQLNRDWINVNHVTQANLDGQLYLLNVAIEKEPSLARREFLIMARTNLKSAITFLVRANSAKNAAHYQEARD